MLHFYYIVYNCHYDDRGTVNRKCKTTFFFPGIKKCNSTKLTFYNNIHFSIFHTKKNELKILSLKHLDGTSVLNNTCNK